jgi:lactoylglutathione lyase
MAGARPRLAAPDYIVLAVEDLDVALAFWVDLLGLRLDHRSDPFVQLATGPTRICLYQREAFGRTSGHAVARDAARARAFEVGFKVDDVDAAWAAFLAAGAEGVCAPTDRPWGQRTAYLSDPDGHLVELAQPLAR